MSDVITSPAAKAETPSSSGSGYLPLLLLLFAGSGCSALIYEVVWYQALQLAIGSTSVSLGVLLATFMGGLCIGSTIFPRLNLTKNHPLRIYAFIELAIAALAILVQFAMPSISQVYWAGAASGLPGMLLRGVVAAVCMLPPTILMGASLPAIVRWLEASPRAVAWWGWLYGGNTAGAVIGCLLAGFWLLRVYNTTAGTLFAAAINLIVALVSLALASSTPRTIPVTGPTPAAEASVAAEAAPSGQSRWPVYLTIALSGAVALGAEVVWTRLLGYLLLATVYVFAIILAVFLTGLAIGTAGGSWLLRKVHPRNALGWCQILLIFGFAWTAYTIVNTFHLPFWNDDVLTTTDGWHMYWLDLKLVAIAIFPAVRRHLGTGTGFRQDCRRHLCGQYTRRHRRRTAGKPRAYPRHRHTEFSARAAARFRLQRPAAPAPASEAGDGCSGACGVCRGRHSSRRQHPGHARRTDRVRPLYGPQRGTI
jgi:spermidine synthase